MENYSTFKRFILKWLSCVLFWRMILQNFALLLFGFGVLRLNFLVRDPSWEKHCPSPMLIRLVVHGQPTPLKQWSLKKHHAKHLVGRDWNVDTAFSVEGQKIKITQSSYLVSSYYHSLWIKTISRCLKTTTGYSQWYRQIKWVSESWKHWCRGASIIFNLFCNWFLYFMKSNTDQDH